MRRYRDKAMAIVFGHTLRDMEQIKQIKAPLPTFFPLIGLSDKAIAEGIRAIREGRPAKSLL
jgi:hypothetical protein